MCSRRHPRMNPKARPSACSGEGAFGAVYKAVWHETQVVRCAVLCCAVLCCAVLCFVCAEASAAGFFGFDGTATSVDSVPVDRC